MRGAASSGATAGPDPRQRILRSAASEIAEQGFHGMSMRSLAKRARMSLSNLYNYFPAKEEILFALQSEAFEVLISSVEEALEPAETAEDHLYVFISHHVGYVAAHPDVMRVLVHEAASLPRNERSAIRSLKERYFGLARSIVARVVETGCGQTATGEALDPAELDRVTYNVFGMLNWLYGWYDPKAHGAPQTVASTIYRLTLCGVVTDCPQKSSRARLDLHLQAMEARPLLGRTPTTGDPP